MLKLNEISFENIVVGMTDSFETTITEDHVQKFGEITGDMNPLHFDENYASETMFKSRIVHGLLTASYISTLIGMLLPGKGALYLTQDLKFLKPVKIGNTIKITGTVTRIIDESRQIFVLQTDVHTKDGTQVISGKAKVMIQKIEN